MEGIGKGFGTFIVIVIIAALLIGSCTTGGIAWLASSGEIRSTDKITPDFELVVKGNTVDTVWVYKSPKSGE